MASSGNKNGSTSDPVPWLAYIDEELITPDTLDVEKNILEAIRALLQAPEHALASVQSAIRQVQEVYKSEYDLEECRWRELPDGGSSALLHSISTYVFELATQAPVASFRNARLAEFLIRLKAEAQRTEDIERPRLRWDDAPLLMVAGECWNRYHVSSHDVARKTLQEDCDMWINLSAFLARLLDAAMLGEDGLHWANVDVSEALQGTVGDSPVYEILQRSRTIIAMQYVLLSGKRLVQEARTPTRRWTHPLNAKIWKAWAEKLKDIAVAAASGVPWDLKTQAGKAHERMVELWPELF